jgi:hypothetical protein
MNALDPWRSAQDEFRVAREALAVLEQAVPAFRTLVVAFREPLCQSAALGAAACSAGLSELAQTLSVLASRLSEGKQVISTNVAIAKDSMQRYRTHLHAMDGGRGAFGELQGLADRTVRGIAEIEHMIAEAERLMEGEVQRILELALRFDVPVGVLQLTQELLDRARR